MNDYYSQFPQPSVDVRARNIVDVMLRDQKFREHFTPDELKDIALEVVKVSKEYSQTGYAEERQHLRVQDELAACIFFKSSSKKKCV